MNYLIGIDIGTSSTKAIAFDICGNVISKANIQYPILPSEDPTYMEQDVEEIFNAVIECIKKVSQENQNNNLLGVSFSSAMHSLIAVDNHGHNLTNCITWADTRSKEYSEKIKNDSKGHQIYMRTGTPIHPMSPLSKLLWMKDNMVKVYDAAYKFISIKEYVFYKLFNRYVIDYSIASATGLFDIYDLKWNEESLNFAMIDKEKLSEPVPTTFMITGMNSYYAEYMKIDPTIPFIIGGSDGCLANLGVNAIKSGNAAVTIGTSGAIRVISSEPNNDSSERIFSYILTEDHYVLGGPVNNGGIIFRWFRDNFSKQELEEAKKNKLDPYDLLIEEASKISAGADGLIFLPYLLGERAPHWDANSRGVYFGININHTRAHFLRALLEGILFGIYSVGKALEETTGKLDVIYATGGFVRSKLWVQMLSDIFNKPVVIADSYESSCFGAVILGMKSLGIIASLEEVEKLVPISKVFQPNLELHEVYMKNYKIYERLYFKLKDEFMEIDALQ